VTPILVFVRPQNPGNIGAMARVLSNFGSQELRLVGEKPEAQPFNRMDWGMACHAQPILEAARWFPTLAAALEGVHVAVGTSGKGSPYEKGYTRPIQTPQEAFSALQFEAQRHGPTFRWALVMGPEDHGLASGESALCQRLICIPTSPQSPSMNVAMATGVLLYHWNLLGQPEPSPFNPAEGAFMPWKDGGWADIQHKERLLGFLSNTLKHTEFFKHPDHDSVKGRLRRWLQSTPIPVHELMNAFEAVYQLRSWGLRNYEPRSFLKTPWEDD
jgi:TrmH family RNA methyltransferase